MNTVMDTNIELLHVMGFKPCMEESIHTLSKNLQTLTIFVYDNYEDDVPNSNTEEFSVILKENGKHVAQFTTEDVRDIMAFTIGIENKFCHERGKNPESHEIFYHGGDVILNPFERKEDGKWEGGSFNGKTFLCHPTMMYGSSYIAWRNTRARKILETKQY